MRKLEVAEAMHTNRIIKAILSLNAFLLQVKLTELKEKKEDITVP